MQKESVCSGGRGNAQAGVPWDRGVLRDKICGDRHGGRPRALSCAGGADDGCLYNRDEDKEHNG